MERLRKGRLKTKWEGGVEFTPGDAAQAQADENVSHEEGGKTGTEKSEVGWSRRGARWNQARGALLQTKNCCPVF